jgi:Thioesterase-like superfamily
MTSESVFIAEGEPADAGAGRYVPTELARGPWDPHALHGGAPAALITSAFERLEPGAELRIGRLGFEFLRPIPMAPLSLRTSIVRPGRRVQELAGELYAHVEESERPLLVCRASALRVQPVPGGLPPAPAVEEDDALPPPDQATPHTFGLDSTEHTSFAASAMEMRWFGDPWQLGPGRVWQRLRVPLLPGQEPTPLVRLAASADFGNGVSASLPFDEFLFINADLGVHLHRPPRGEWIGLDARTMIDPGGCGLSESVLHDEDGPLGRAFQTLVVGRRG